MLKTLRATFLRIDPRSLGLFRIAFALALILDWRERFRYVRDFYSNDGVLPNHNHIFVLHDQHRVWSALHAFSSVGENTFALCAILVAYVLLLVGYKTRVFHAISLVALVSLTGRNLLLENSGNYIAIALAMFTLFLPLGTRFSLDSLQRSMAARDEKDADDLNARHPPTEAELFRTRGPGWSPVSLAALAVLLQLAIVFAVSAYQRSGSWLDGTALHYALGGELFVSPVGVRARELSPAILSVWTRLLRATEIAVPLLIFIPLFPRISRTAAVAFTLFYGLTFGLLFDFGLYGWALAAASALLISPASWDARLAPDPRRAVTVIYDADCGVCLWVCRVLARLDLRHHLVFQGNDALETLTVRPGNPYRGGDVTKADLPKEVTPDLVLNTVVAVDVGGRVETRGQAVATVVRALPLGFIVAGPMRLPGLSHLLNLAYDFVAARRQRISVLMGKDACGIPDAEPEENASDLEAEAEEVPPALRLLRTATGGVRELLALVVLIAAVAQTAHSNPIPRLLPLSRPLAAIAQWPRMMARWDVLAPEPSHDDAMMVIDAQTRGGPDIPARDVDPLNGQPPGYEPGFDPGAANGAGLGQLWGNYLIHIREKEWAEFQRAFRDYLGKGGLRWSGQTGENSVAGYDAYWVTQPIPPPGTARDPEEIQREKLFTFSRGGRTGGLAPLGGAMRRPAH